MLVHRRAGSQFQQSVPITPGPDADEGHTGGRIEMSAYTIFAIIVGLAFDRIEIREIEAILKIARVEIGKAVFGEKAGLIGERRLKDEIADAPAEIGASREYRLCASKIGRCSPIGSDRARWPAGFRLLCRNFRQSRRLIARGRHWQTAVKTRCSQLVRLEERNDAETFARKAWAWWVDVERLQ